MILDITLSIIMVLACFVTVKFTYNTVAVRVAWSPAGTQC